jgi:MerR family transcriptional regulator, light-induced transcriptional regulator
MSSCEGQGEFQGKAQARKRKAGDGLNSTLRQSRTSTDISASTSAQRCESTLEDRRKPIAASHETHCSAPQTRGCAEAAAARSPVAKARDLSATVEAEVIPRLLMAHSAGLCHAPALEAARAGLSRYSADAGNGAPRRGVDGRGVQAADAPLDATIAAQMAVHEGATALVARIDMHVQAGMTLSSVFLDVLAPAARLLGTLWMDDLYSFADVTIGLCRLRQAFEELRSEQSGPLQGQGEHFTALVAPSPGDDHGFGAAMISHLFTQAGWAVLNEGRGDADVLLRILKTQHIDLLGLSLNTDQALEPLPGLVLKVRQESKNRALVVFIGGSLIGARPEIAREVGAIAAPADPFQAIEMAEQIVRRAARRM